VILLIYIEQEREKARTARAKCKKKGNDRESPPGKLEPQRKKASRVRHMNSKRKKGNHHQPCKNKKSTQTVREYIKAK
jgi:hypothetical protein